MLQRRGLRETVHELCGPCTPRNHPGIGALSIHGHGHVRRHLILHMLVLHSKILQVRRNLTHWWHVSWRIHAQAQASIDDTGGHATEGARVLVHLGLRGHSPHLAIPRRLGHHGIERHSLPMTKCTHVRLATVAWHRSPRWNHHGLSPLTLPYLHLPRLPTLLHEVISLLVGGLIHGASRVVQHHSWIGGI